MKQRIGVIGSGDVGQTLASGFLKYGYEVMIGTRKPESLANWQKDSANRGQVGNITETAKFGDIVVLAVKGIAAMDVVKQAGINNLKGKTVIDVTNPIAQKPPVNGVISFFTSLDESLIEQMQRLAPEANFVKAFNSVGYVDFVNPKYAAGKPSMFLSQKHPRPLRPPSLPSRRRKDPSH